MIVIMWHSQSPVSTWHAKMDGKMLVTLTHRPPTQKQLAISPGSINESDWSKCLYRGRKHIRLHFYIRATIAKLSQVIAFSNWPSVFSTSYVQQCIPHLPYVQNYMYMVDAQRVRAPLKQDAIYIKLRCEGNCCVRVVVSFRVWSKAFSGMAPF